MWPINQWGPPRIQYIKGPLSSDLTSSLDRHLKAEPCDGESYS